jgi:formylglycine-generating enzyme required for sulfatase activity
MFWRLGLVLGLCSLGLFANENTAPLPIPASNISPQTNKEKPHFMRNSLSQIVLSKEQKLIWQDNKATIDPQYSWDEAQSYCQALVFSGFKDWRMPSKAELESIAVDGKVLKTPDVSAFKYYKISSYYWTGSEDESYESNAWLVYMNPANSYYNNKAYKGCVRCVRDK